MADRAVPDPPADLLAGAAWRLTEGPTDCADPADLPSEAAWIDAEVPGTVASACRASGLDSPADPDRTDWWFRARFPGRRGPYRLELDGLATVAEVWLNGIRLASSENMFVPLRLDVTARDGENELFICFRSIEPRLRLKRPRPRWKTALVAEQSLRWIRTCLLGRTRGGGVEAAPVGPYRPVRMVPTGPWLSRRTIRSDWSDGRAELDLSLRVELPAGKPWPSPLRLSLGGTELPQPRVTGIEPGSVQMDLVCRPDWVEAWWPHTHGASPVYELLIHLGDTVLQAGSVGFRHLSLDRSGGGLSLLVNGQEVFCRGGCWVPLDPVRLHSSAEELYAAVGDVQRANANMVRLTGTMVYEQPAFWDACDQLGIMVWLDCMLANVDPPDDPEWCGSLENELATQLSALSGRPSPAIVCGGSEIEQQAAMLGLPPDRRRSRVLEELIPAAVGTYLPGVPWLPNSPTGGEPPFRVDTGAGHYFGVGAYLRPLSDARSASVTFASECLAFSIPADRLLGERPEASRGVPRDAGADWDFEDVRNHYVRLLFGVDPQSLRPSDEARYADLGQAAVAEVMSQVMTEWRRPGSTCRGGLVLSWRDLLEGAGWGLTDSTGRPKAPWYALRRTWAPVCVLITDEGVNGLSLHALNDRAEPFDGRLVLRAWSGDRLLEEAATPVVLPGRSAGTFGAEELIGGFRDLGYTFRFGPPTYDVVAGALFDSAGECVSEAVHLPLGQSRPRQDDLGLEAGLERDGDGWAVRLQTRRLAQWVSIRTDGAVPSDSWFHLVPGRERAVDLHVGPVDLRAEPPRVEVSALNGLRPVPAGAA